MPFRAHILNVRTAANAVLAPLLLAWPLMQCAAAEVLVATPGELTAQAAIAWPGDIIMMRDGVWNDADLLFIANGTPANPVTLRPQTMGGVHLTGQSRLRMAGSHIVVDGLVFTNGYRTSDDVIAFRESSTSVANNSRLTNCSVIDFNPPNPTNDTKWVSLYGVSNRVENCYLKGKVNVGATLVVWVEATPNYHVISRNHFGPRPVLTAASNGGETIRVGTSDVSMNNSRTLVENNYFEQCNGDVEMISSKSCENTYRRNTFVECEGSLTLRHGNRCVVEGNYFLGRNKPQTGGVRIIGEDHKVINNYFQDLTGANSRAALVFMQGIVNSPLSGYFQVQRATVAFNTFINCASTFIIGLSGSSGTNLTTLPPVDCVIGNNIAVQASGKLIDQKITPVNLAWEGNILFGATLGITTNSGTLRIDPLMTSNADGLYRPGMPSPAAASAEGSYPFVTQDFEGDARPAAKDVGADQRSTLPPQYPPLTADNVGPVWRRTFGTLLTWNVPAPITYGTPLGDAQLNAGANAAGVFTYDPPAGTILDAGIQVLSVTFTPRDTTNYNTATRTVTINVLKSTPTILWTNPVPIAYGTALTAIQLNPSCTASGTFTFNPPAGTILNAGSGQRLSAIFTPAEAANYLSATSSVMLDVTRAIPVITWNTPAAIEQGTALSVAQLNATANAPGTMVYSPPLGTVVSAGSRQTLSVSFFPLNTDNFLSATASVTLNVTIGGKTRPEISWPSPATIVYGAPLSSAQLNATADVPGVFSYSPAVGTILPAGNGQLLTARFIPNDTTNYILLTNTVTIDVRAVPTNPLVRIAYLIPTNRLGQAHAVPTLQNVIQQYQRFFSLEMARNGFGPKTFSYETLPDGVTPAIHILRVAATDLYLRSDFTGNRVLETARAAGFPVGAPGQLWWFVPECHVSRGDGIISGGFNSGFYSPTNPLDSGWLVTGGDSLALYQTIYQTNAALYDGMILPDLGAFPLVQDVSFPWFEGITISGISSSQVGAGLRALGSAFGLESDFRNDENFNGNVMGFGFRGIRGVFYPDRYPYNYCGLSVAAALALNVNPFFNPGRPLTDTVAPHVTASTSGSVTPVSGLLEIGFHASDNFELSALLLKWHTDSGPVVVSEVIASNSELSGTFATPYYDGQQTNRYTITAFDRQGNRASVDTLVYPVYAVNHSPEPFVRAIPVIAGLGEDVMLDATDTHDAEHGAGYLEIEWDLNGDGFFDTAPAGDLFYIANFAELGTRFVRARITDPAGDVAISAPIAITIIPCSTSLSPTNKSHGYGYSTGTVIVTTTAKCIWTASTTNDWIKIISGEMAGPGQLTYYTEPNPNFFERRGSILIGDQHYSVVQEPTACTFSVTSSRFHGYGAGSGTMKVTTKDTCTWNVVNTNTWITITAGLSGTNTDNVSYSIAENRGFGSRSGYLVVSGAVCKITQWGTNCEAVISPEGRLHSENSETGTVSISTASGCPWTVVNTNDWIELTTPGFGTTSSNIGYTLAPNVGSASRVGALLINDQPFVITQQVCSFVLSKTNVSHTFLAGTGIVAVAAGPVCQWEIVNPSDWITIIYPFSNIVVGTNVVNYIVRSNETSQARVATLTIANQPVTITQSGHPCVIDIAPTEYEHGEESGSGDIEVFAAPGCPWTVLNDTAWVHILDGASGEGPGYIVYTVDANTGPARSATFTVATADEQMDFAVSQPSGIRLVSTADSYLGSGATNSVTFTLSAHGGENRLGFSLCFDTTLLEFLTARLQFGAPVGAALEINTNDTSLGRVGISVALPPGWSMPAGTSTVVNVTFRGANIIGKQTTTIGICDSPTPRALTNAVGQPLTVQFTSPSVQVIGFCSFAEAVDALDLAWTNSSIAWSCQTNITHDHEDAAVSGILADGEQSYFETVLIGPGTLTFWWRVSSESGKDLLRFYLGSSEQFRISGEVDWEWRTFNLPAGTNRVRWIYSKNSSSAAGADRGWVDEISYQPSAPIITSHPVSRNVDSGATATFTAAASGQPPLSYRWLSNGVPMLESAEVRGTATPTLTLANVQSSQAAAYAVIVSSPQGNSMSSNAVLTVTQLRPLADAIDVPYSLASGGTAPWVGQSVIAHDGVDAGRSGNITHSQNSTFTALVAGPGTITFWWKVSSEPSNDKLTFSINGSVQATISGEVDWQQKTFTLNAGTNTLLWNYSKNSSTTAGQDRGWVDELRFIPTAVGITAAPTNQTVDQGATATFAVSISGTPPFSYQWRVNGTNIFNATNATLALPNTQPNDAGTYSVLVANAAGSVTSPGATLTVNRLVPLDEAVDSTNLNFTVTGTPPWVGQTLVSRDGVDAARSGRITHSQSTSFQTTVTGPGSVSFWWKVSSEPSNDRLAIYLDGSSSANISGEVDWAWRTLTFGSGSHTLEWRYTKNSSTSSGQDSGWVDQIVFVSSNNPTAPVIALQPMSRIVVPPTNVTFNVLVVGTPPLSYQWFFKGAPLTNGAGISGANATNLTISGVSVTNAGEYSVIVSNAAGSVISSAASLAVVTAPVITATPLSQNVIAGSTVTFTVNAIGQAPLAYQWMFNGTNLSSGAKIGGATTATLTLTNVQSAQQGAYSVLVSNAAGVAISSVSSGALKTWEAARMASVANSESTAFEASVVGPGVIQFTWRVSSETNSDALRFSINGVEITNISGEVDWREESFSVPAGVQTLRWAYTKDSSGAAGFDAGWLDSVRFEEALTSAAPALVQQPVGQTVLGGSTLTLEALAIGSAPLTYQWRLNGVALQDGSSIAGATTPRLTLANVQPVQAGSYTLLIANSAGSSTSTVATIAITNAPTPATPVITTQPIAQSVSENGITTLAVAAAGAPPLSYQWQFNGIKISDTVDTVGSTTPTLVLSNLTPSQAGDYSMIVSNSSGTVTSSVAALNVLALGDAAGAPYLDWKMAGFNSWVAQTSVSHDGATAVRSGMIPDGQNTRLETWVDGPGTITFWWKSSCESGNDNLRFYIGATEMARISGEVDWQQQTFSVPSGSQILLKWRYGKDASGSSGQDAAWIDDVRYVFTGAPLAPVITNAPANLDVLAGGTATFAAGVGGTPPLFYEWRSNGIAVASSATVVGANSPRLTLKNVQPWQSGTYSLFVSNSAGTIATIPVTLGVAPIIAKPQITAGPAPQTAVERGAATFTAVAIGAAPLSFQWWFNGAALPQATNSTLVLANVGFADVGNYAVSVSNSSGVAFSTPAPLIVRALNDILGAPYLTVTNVGTSPWTVDKGQSAGGATTNAGAILTVSTPPAITAQPRNQTVIAGDEVTLAVTATGSDPLAYQWRFNGLPLTDGLEVDGATTATLTLAAADVIHAGTYSVVVSNLVGAVVSSNVALNVLMPPMITVQPIGQVVLEGATVTLNVAVTGTGLSYQWRRDGTNLGNSANISGAKSPTLILNNVQSFQSGAYSVLITNAAGLTLSESADVIVNAPMAIGDAINAPYLPGNTSLDAPWTVQTNVTHDGEGALRSGAITNSGVTWFETTVSGPGAIHFWWKVSSQTNGDALQFYVSDALWASISGEVDWQKMSFNLPAGTMTLRWAYAKDGSISDGLDAGWLDEVDFVPTTGPSVPVIVQEPVDLVVPPGTNVSFTVEALGTAPLTYQWRFEGQNLSDSPDVLGTKSPTLTLMNVDAVNSGLYDVVVKNPYSIAISRQVLLNVVRSIPLREALDTDNTNLVWITGGQTAWFGQTDVKADRIDAAQSGPLLNGQSNYLQTIVNGPGAISFMWKVSSETNADRLRFSINGVEQANISGEVDWRSRTFFVPLAGSVLQWTYTKNATNSVGLDRAFLDTVTFGPSAPIITNSGPDVSYIDQGTTLRLSVDPSGTPKFSYQWSFNGTNLVDSDTNFPGPGNIIGSTGSSRLTISNAQPYQSGLYVCEVLNAAGAAISEPMSVQVIPALPLGPALNEALVWETGGWSWWVGTTNITHDGVMSARNGTLPNNRSTWMRTAVTGPGTLKFWWKASTETNVDYLTFSINGSEMARISGNKNWEQKSFDLNSLGDSYILEWEYTKNGLLTNGLDQVWVDEVTFTKTPPTITNQPIAQTVDAGSTVTFTVGARGTPPLIYNWMCNGVLLTNGNGVSGQGTTSLKITGVQTNQAGAYSVIVSNDGGEATSTPVALTVIPIFALADALDTMIASFSSSSPAWVGQPTTTHDGIDAGRSPLINHSQSSTMQATLVGPGTVSFWWKVSSETNKDYLTFYIGNTEQARISGDVNWQQRTYTLGSGTNTLKWTYSKNSSGTVGQDRGWVDELVLIPVPPTIAAQPIGAVVDEDTSISLGVTVAGTPPFNFQWFHEGTPLSDGPFITGANLGMLTLSNIQTSQAGRYWVTVGNAAGSATSSNATVSVTPTVPLAVALDGTNFTWTTTGSANWVGQLAVTHDGIDAARIANVAPSTTSSFEATLLGPGTISFWWKVSSEPTNDRLVFYTNNTEVARISGEVDWEERALLLGPGTYTLRWSYTKNGSVSAGQDRAWVDQVIFGPVAPSFATQPTNSFVDAGSNATFTVRMAGTPPFTYQWQRNGSDVVDGPGISGANSSNLVLVGVQPDQAGSYRVLVSGPAGTAVSSTASLNVYPALSLNEALETPALAWETTAAAAWIGHGLVTHDAVDAARSAAIGNSSTSAMSTVVTGPGAVSFWWKVSSQTNSDYLSFFTNGVLVARISGEVDWQFRTIDLDFGDQEIRWAYSKNGSSVAGSDRGWVDQVTFGPVPPTITTQPQPQNVDVDGVASFVVANGGTPPFTYQWQRNGNDLVDGAGISGAQSSNLVITAVQQDQAGSYGVLISGAAGVTNSALARLNVFPPLPLAEALDTTNIVWLTNSLPAGLSSWTGHGATNHDGVDAGRSAIIGNNQSNSMSAVVIGPGTLTFWWKVSSETNNDKLLLLTNGVEAARISGEMNWQIRTVHLGAGSNNIQWTYGKNGSTTAGADRGWVDQVSFGMLAPSIASQPASITTPAGSSALISVTAGGTPPLFHQWLFNGAPLINGSGIAGALSPSLVISNVQAGRVGSYSVVITNSAGSVTSINASLVLGTANTNTGPVTLNESLDGGLTFTTGGTGDPWAGQRAVTHDNIDAAETGSVSDSTYTWIKATVTGPGPLTFWWRVSSEQDHDYLRFMVDAVDQTRISGDVGWQQVSYSVPSGTHELQWRYSKNASLSAGQDRGWVDQVYFGVSQPTNDPGVVDPPVILIQPAGLIAEDGDVVSFSVAAASSHPLTYRWFYNGTNLLANGGKVAGAGTAQLTLLGATAGQAGEYSVIVSNAGGWIPSASARLSINPAIDLAEAVDTLDLFVTTDGEAPWTGHGVITKDGMDAGRSGIVSDGQHSAMHTTVIGPGLLSFWWKVSSETNADFLTFSADGTPQASISGEVNWRQRFMRVEDGPHYLDWIYDKNLGGSAGADRGWVDQLIFVADGSGEEIPPPVGAMVPRIRVDGSRTQLTWTGRTDRTYRVYYKDNLADSQWTQIDDEVLITWRVVNGTVQTDSITATFEEPLGGRTKFYRVLEY